MKLDVVTLFPAWFDWFRSQRHVANALAQGSTLTTIDPRAHTPLTGGQVDDAPFGGGAGMVLRVDVMDATLRAHYGVDPVSLRSTRRVIALAPTGRVLDDALVGELAGEPALTFLCGRYEGIDQRALDLVADDEISLGDFVLAGGELAALCVIEAVVRLLPSGLGNNESAREESFGDGLLEYPHYTQPARLRGLDVPEVLRSGDHARIARWRRAQSLARTQERRPDLIEARGGLSEQDRVLLDEFPALDATDQNG